MPGEQQGRGAVRHHRRRRVTRGEVARRLCQRPLAVRPQLERYDERRDGGHGQDRVHGRASVVPQPGDEDRARQYGDGDLHVAQIGEEVRERSRTASRQLQAEPFVGIQQRAVGQHLPGDHEEEREQRSGRRNEKNRPPGNRGDCSEVAGRTGLPRAPGGVGRAAIRSVRSPGARSSSGVRDGTAGTALGELRPGIARSPLRAGCFSHLGKPYVRGRRRRKWQRYPAIAPAHLLHTPSPGRRSEPS